MKQDLNRRTEHFPRWQVFTKDIDCGGTTSPEYTFFEDVMTRLDAVRNLGDVWAVVNQQDRPGGEWRPIMFVRLQDSKEAVELGRAKLAVAARNGK